MSNDIDLILNTALEKLGITEPSSKEIVPEILDDEIHILDAIQDYENKNAKAIDDSLDQENERVAEQFKFLDELQTLNIDNPVPTADEKTYDHQLDKSAAFVEAMVNTFSKEDVKNEFAEQLKVLINLPEKQWNEFGRLNQFEECFDRAKARIYFEDKTGSTLSDFKVNVYISKLLNQVLPTQELKFTFKSPSENETSAAEVAQLEPTDSLDSAPVVENAVKTEKFDWTVFEEKRSYKSETGREMAAFPKLGVREANNTKKIASWYYDELIAEMSSATRELALQMGNEQYTLELVKKANQLLFGNPNGPEQRHKIANKDELKAMAEEKERERKHILLTEAQKRLNPEVMAEALKLRENKLKISSVVERTVLESRSPAFAKELTQVLESAIEKCPEPVAEVPEIKEVVQTVVENQSKVLPQSPSYYALVCQGEIIGSGRADKISHDILFNMAKDAKATLIWSENELNQKTDLVQFFGIQNVTPSPTVNYDQGDQFDKEVLKGQRMLSTQKTLKTTEPGITLGEVIVNPQINIKKDHSLFDVNEYQKKQMMKIVKRIDAEMPNADLQFYFDKNKKDVIVSIKNQNNQTSYFGIGQDFGPTKLDLTVMEAVKRVAQLEWNKLELMDVCTPISEQTSSQTASFNN